ncbi:MAG: VanW family protein [Eubacteriales bacterium]|nr:VanW family protein [Eubacteriales bacterium]
MKRLLLIYLSLFMMIPVLGFAGAQPLYTAQLRYSGKVYDTPGGTLFLRTLSKGVRVDIYEVLPAWLKIGREGTVLGYIQREKLDDYTVESLVPALAPTYPGVQNTYLGWVAAEAPVRDRPGEDGETLITLTAGARLAFLNVEDGWAKLIFKRQYGYVDTRLLSELQMINASADAHDDQAPIAAYTSFYKISTDEDNIGRIKNLQVSCDKFELIRIMPGGNFNFNRDLGPYRRSNGYFPAIVLVDGGTALGYGGGTCQVSSTLYNVVLQLPGLKVDHRRPHGPGGISYLPHGADAAVGTESLNFKFTNNYPFPIRPEGTVQDGALTITIWRADAA